MVARQFLMLALAGSTAWAAESSKTCFFPDGSVAAADVPCTNGTYSHCCGTTGICLTNGFCMNSGSQPFTISRGSCTDSSWGSSCPSRCHGSSDNPGGGIAIVLFQITNGVSTYCCGNPLVSNGKLACPNDQAAFTLNNADLIFGVGYLNGYTNVTSAATNTTGNTSNSTNSTTTDTCTKSNELAVGAGVGVGLGAIAIAAIAWALWERRRGQKRDLPAVHTASDVAPLKSAMSFSSNGGQQSQTTAYQATPYTGSASPATYQAPLQQHAYTHNNSPSMTSPDIATVPVSAATPLAPQRSHYAEMPGHPNAVEMMDTAIYPPSYGQGRLKN
ncbi:hypothetical protein GQ53DRAFT_755549 [Thozetella sp. PMI_491]|nr:hypothetical protein GQ53DRAFT_755549 [Thozetella sp. PMI_491]